MQLHPWQKKIIDNNNFSVFLVWECRSGKTLASIEWAKLQKEYPVKPALVVVPKALHTQWKNNCKEYNFKAIVLTKEQFKKTPPDISTISSFIGDEIHHFSGNIFFGKQRSQLAICLYNFLSSDEGQKLPRLIATATPIRSHPFNLHTLLLFTGIFIEWKKWRDHFYEKKRVNYSPYPIWLPNANWRVKIRPFLEKYADIVLYRNCVDFVPDETEETINIKTKYPPVLEEWTTMARWHEMHRAEAMNPLKLSHIKKIGEQYRKILVVCYYREQVEFYAKELAKDKTTYHAMGGINAGEVAKQAEEDDECYFVVQSSCAEGWEFGSASICIFATLDFSYYKYTQVKGRIRNMNKREPIIYQHLIGGKYDKNVVDQISKGKDFDCSEYTRTNTKNP
jgi:superfamily II DNA or RNA helicase